MNTHFDNSEPKNSVDDYFYENMKKSYDFWHHVYLDSPLNISLIWKKALESNLEISTKLQKELQNTAQKGQTDLKKFLEEWHESIRESNFKKAVNSISHFWINSSDTQTKFYFEMLEMLEKYWRNIQDKNIE
jgi:vacuolar-type H+-ATPase subunit H